MDKEQILALLAKALSTPLPPGYGVEVDERAGEGPTPADRERRVRRLVAEGRIALMESSSVNVDGGRWTASRSRRIRRLDDSLSDQDIHEL